MYLRFLYELYFIIQNEIPDILLIKYLHFLNFPYPIIYHTLEQIYTFNIYLYIYIGVGNVLNL